MLVWDAWEEGRGRFGGRSRSLRCTTTESLRTCHHRVTQHCSQRSCSTQAATPQAQCGQQRRWSIGKAQQVACRE